jgi:phage terminase large subunit
MSFIRTTAVDKILKMNKRYRVIPGGSSAGKTIAIIAILIDIAIKNPGKRIDIVSESFPHLTKGAISDFKMIMESTSRWYDAYWHDTKHIYTFSNKSFIRFIAMDKPGKARGPRRDILYVNEANLIDFEVYDQLVIRTNDFVFIDYNPSHRFWVDDEVLPLDDSEMLKLTYRDNESISENILNDFEIRREKAKISEYWANWCKVYLDGELGTLDGVIFNNWNTIDNIPEEAVLIGYGMDFGYTNDPTTLIGVYKYNNQIIVDEVIYQKGLSNTDIIKHMKDNNISGEIYADSAEPKTIDEIKSYGFNIRPTKKGKDSIVFGISLMQDKDILITSKSKNTIREFTEYSWKKSKDGSSDNIPEDFNNHSIDSIRYLFLMKLNNSPEVSISYGKTSFNSKWAF